MFINGFTGPGLFVYVVIVSVDVISKKCIINSNKFYSYFNEFQLHSISSDKVLFLYEYF